MQAPAGLDAAAEEAKGGEPGICAIEWQPSEAAFDVTVWPRPKTERASQGKLCTKRPYSVPAMPDRMMFLYTQMGFKS